MKEMRTGVRSLAPALVALCAVLAIGNWYVTPARGASWAITLAFIAFLVVPIWMAHRVELLRKGGADWLWNGVVFAGLMLSVGLGGKLAHALGVIDDQNVSRRLTMALTGAFLAMVGNLTPKTITPLSMACDGARTQAFQRFTGWTWFIAGLTYAMVWLVMPIDLAESVGIIVIMAGMLLVAWRLFQHWRTRRSAA
jgi:hypothetical protein